MEELLKALTEAVKNGSAAAGPALHSYFTFKIIETVVAYCVPCLAIVIVVMVIARNGEMVPQSGL